MAKNGGSEMLRGDPAGSSPEVEHGYNGNGERGRLADGKGLNYAGFSDAATPFDVFEPHRPAENPAGHYSIPEGAGKDNTRGLRNGGRRRRRG